MAEDSFTEHEQGMQQRQRDWQLRLLVALVVGVVGVGLALYATLALWRADGLDLSRALAGPLLEAVNTLLTYDKNLRIAIEPKPNEPMDMAYIPTIGHALAIAFKTDAPQRVGCLVETAHAILAGLDPSDEMAFALAFDKLYSVHLNDQNGLKFDEDRAFGSIDLRRAFNQVRVLDDNQFYKKGMVGMDVKAMRTQPVEIATKHLRNSLQLFLRLVEVVRDLDRKKIAALISARDYEELDWLILTSLINR